MFNKIKSFFRPRPEPKPTPNSFTKWGYDWQINSYESPNTDATNQGTFIDSNVSQSNLSPIVILNLQQTQENNNGSIVALSKGAEIQTINTFGFGTFTFDLETPKEISGTVYAGFLFINNSQTEIDVEFQGQFPGVAYLSNWNTINKETTSNFTNFPLITEHQFKIVWKPTNIEWYIDDNLIYTSTTNISQTPAYFIFNLYGTNTANWGGLADFTQPNRQLVITNFSYHS